VAMMTGCDRDARAMSYSSRDSLKGKNRHAVLRQRTDTDLLRGGRLRFPLLLIPGGGLNSSLSMWQAASPFNPMERYKDDFRCICADLRNANPGRSTGPLEIDRPWDAYTDDQLGLMDHLGIREFLVMGFCIGGPMIHNLIRR